MSTCTNCGCTLSTWCDVCEDRQALLLKEIEALKAELAGKARELTEAELQAGETIRLLGEKFAKQAESVERVWCERSAIRLENWRRYYEKLTGVTLPSKGA